jgi:hypothetical protein
MEGGRNGKSNKVRIEPIVHGAEGTPCGTMSIYEGRAKYLAMGEFEKMKARLGVDGRDQDATIFPNKSPPPHCSNALFFTVLGIAGMIHWWIVIKIDAKGSFIQTPMTGENVYIRISKNAFRQVHYDRHCS